MKTTRIVIGAFFAAIAGSSFSSAFGNPPSLERTHSCMDDAESLAQLATCESKLPPMSGYTFAVEPALPCKGPDVQIETRSFGYIHGDRNVLFAEKWTKSCATPHNVEWADSRTCRALKPTLDSLSGVESPKMLSPGFNFRSANSVLDGASYEIYGPAIYLKERAVGWVRLSGNVDSPIAAWVESFLKRTASCWSEAAPKLD
jgi:hypothetical protein